MGELKLTGKIVKILEKTSGTSKAGNDWVKQEFVIDTEEQYNNIICFNVFGQEKVDNFEKYNKLDDKVTVSFNVNCREWEGKYFTDIQAWNIRKVEDGEQPAGEQPKEITGDGPTGDMPF